MTMENTPNLKTCHNHLLDVCYGETQIYAEKDLEFDAFVKSVFNQIVSK